MKLDGTILNNLQAALSSAKRLRGHPVHKDTLAFWRELLAHSRAAFRGEAASEKGAFEPLLAALEAELAMRDRSAEL
jgi:hypothetical protein